MDNRNPSSLNTPAQQPGPSKIKQRANRAKKKLEGCFKQFHELMLDKVLDSNKTTAVKNTERKIVDDLLHAVAELENANVGQGMLSLLTISIREHIFMRDRVNELEYELYKTKKDFRDLQKSIKKEYSTDGKK